MIKKIRNILNDPDVDFQTKSFVLFASITLIGLILAMISGILLGQALSANVFVFIQVCFSTVIFAWALYRNAIKKAMVIEMTLAKRYDVILMDHIMPGMDGIECLKRMRTQPGGACTDAPIIALTANAGVENQQLYDSAGFDGCLVKPILGEKLEEALIEFLPKDKIIMNDTKQEA